VVAVSLKNSGQALGSGSTYAVALGDVDGDGDLDIVAGNNAQADRLYLNNAKASVAVGDTVTVRTAAGIMNVAGTSPASTSSGAVAGNWGEQASVTVTSSPAGLEVIVDSVPYTAPQVFAWAAGSPHTIEVSSPQSGGAGTQYVYSAWSDAGAQSHSASPISDITYTATFTTQYEFTWTASPAGTGTVSPTSGSWHDAGQVISVQATPAAGYQFLGWSGVISGSTNPRNLTMDAPKAVTAQFTAVPPPPSGCSPSAAGGSASPLAWLLPLMWVAFVVQRRRGSKGALLQNL
jgi:hypothetical protein